LDRPDHLIRAARHYEGAAQILIRHAVMTAKQVQHVHDDDDDDDDDDADDQQSTDLYYLTWRNY
jgi:hypothetical protein